MSESPGNTATPKASRLFSPYLPFAWMAWVALCVLLVWLGVNARLGTLAPNSSDPAMFMCCSTALFALLLLPVWLTKTEGRKGMVARAVGSALIMVGPLVAGLVFVQRISPCEMDGIFPASVLLFAFTLFVATGFLSLGRWYLPLLTALVFIPPLLKFLLNEASIARTGKEALPTALLPDVFGSLSGIWDGAGANGGGSAEWIISCAIYGVATLLFLSLGVREK